MNYTLGEIWLIIALMGIGTYLIRFSFLGLIGDRAMHPFVLRLLRFTPVAVLPGMVAPLALWPAATDGNPDPVRLVATLVTLIVGVWRKNVIWAVFAGAATLYVALIVTGQL